MIATAPPPFNWQSPDYRAVIQGRIESLRRLRADPALLPRLCAHYAAHPADFISAYGVTLDPRNPERGLPASVPFVLFPMQRALIEFVLARWRAASPGLIEKSRDVGASWLVMALSVTLCIFQRGLCIGVGSRKEQLLDNAGDPSSLFAKARMFLESLPPEFRPPYASAHMRLIFPATGSAIVGEAGDQIGRGARTSIYFVDEACYLERPELIEGSLSATTNCRIDVSSVNGLNNPFARKRFSGKVPVFTAHWSADPRKGTAWYTKQCATLDPVTVAQEIDIDYRGSVEGQLIPSAWVQAAIGAHLRLNVRPTGTKRGALDVADEGRDANAFAARHGILLEFLQSWSGKGGDIFRSVVKTFALCEQLGYEHFDYDADGLGAGVRGDARTINEARAAAGKPSIRDEPFRGSGAVWQPESELVPKRKNKDFFANAKAQAWWALRLRFQATFRAVVERMPYDPDALISIDPALPELLPLTMELSQVTYAVNTVGKVVIDKAPDGMRSPNLADAVMIAFQPASRMMELWMKLGA